jgi:hypothetical protein
LFLFTPCILENYQFPSRGGGGIAPTQCHLRGKDGKGGEKKKGRDILKKRKKGKRSMKN